MDLLLGSSVLLREAGYLLWLGATLIILDGGLALPFLFSELLLTFASIYFSRISCLTCRASSWTCKPQARAWASSRRRLRSNGPCGSVLSRNAPGLWCLSSRRDWRIHLLRSFPIWKYASRRMMFFRFLLFLFVSCMLVDLPGVLLLPIVPQWPILSSSRLLSDAKTVSLRTRQFL